MSTSVTEEVLTSIKVALEQLAVAPDAL